MFWFVPVNNYKEVVPIDFSHYNDKAYTRTTLGWLSIGSGRGSIASGWGSIVSGWSSVASGRLSSIALLRRLWWRSSWN